MKHFTLVELLVTICIIVVLSAIGVPAIIGARAKAKVAQCKASMNALELAITQYYDTYRSWPGTVYADNDTSSSVRPTTGIRNVLMRENWTGGNWSYETMIKVLQAENNAHSSLEGGNARKKVFLPVQGNEPGVYADPWGNNFRIYVSRTRNGKIVIDDDNVTGDNGKHVPGLSHDMGSSGKKRIIYKDVLIVSAGDDGNWSPEEAGDGNSGLAKEENMDNVYSVPTHWVENVGHEIAQ